ncbi:MAG: glycosyltransferase family 2 protein [Halarcobacter sp.]
MINILIPLAGKNQFFSETEYPFPKPLIELNDKTMIELVINNFDTIKEKKQFIFIVNSDDCKKYHLDNVLNLLTNDNCKIIQINYDTKGAACSAMMAIEYINNEEPLIIANADQLFDDDLGEVISTFNNVDGGVISFESIHPRWSYVRVDEHNYIVETAEKRPLSKHAIAGFFYFKEGKDFIDSAMNMIKKDVNVNKLYYISPTFNEMVLNNKKLTVKTIDNDKYHTFYTPQKIKEYARLKKC